MNDYEKKVFQINSENNEHLENFRKWLENQGLSHKTISNHVNNVDFYINDYLCYYKPQSFKAGYNSMEEYDNKIYDEL